MKKLKIFMIINLIIIISIASFLSFYFSKSILNNIDFLSTEIVGLILIFTFLIFYCIVNVKVCYAIFLSKLSDKKILYVLSILLLNIFILIIAKITINDKEMRISGSGKWRTIDLIHIAIGISMYVLLDFIASFIPLLPFYIVLSIKFIPIFFMVFILRFSQSFLICAISGGVSWFMPNNFDAGNPPAFLFDYYAPVLVISISSFLKPTLNTDKNTQFFAWFCFITIPFIFIYMFRVIAGVLFYFQNAWDGFDKYKYSLIINFFGSMVDYILIFSTVPTICSTLKYIKNRQL